MALPTTGALTLAAVNTELGISAVTKISMNDTAVRTIAGKSSGSISFADLRGKSAINDTKVISANLYNGGYYYGASLFTVTNAYKAGGSITPAALNGFDVSIISCLDFSGSTPTFIPYIGIKATTWNSIKFKDANGNLLWTWLRSNSSANGSSNGYNYWMGTLLTGGYATFNLFPVGSTRYIEMT